MHFPFTFLILFSLNFKTLIPKALAVITNDINATWKDALMQVDES